MKLPADLTERTQWVLWRYEQRSDGMKPTKVPYTCQGYKASTTNPQHWSKFDYAVKMARRPEFADGIGFVFTADDPFCGIDCDNAWLSDAAEMSPWAEQIEQRFIDTYREQSPSETGFKIFCRAHPSRCGKWPVKTGAVEIYDHGRFFTVTGRADDCVPRRLTDHQRDIELLIANLERFTRPSGPVRIPAQISTGERHPTLVQVAGSLWRRGLEAEEIETVLLEINRKRCQPPRTEEHIRQIVKSMAGWKR